MAPGSLQLESASLVLSILFSAPQALKPFIQTGNTEFGVVVIFRCGRVVKLIFCRPARDGFGNLCCGSAFHFGLHVLKKFLEVDIPLFYFFHGERVCATDPKDKLPLQGAFLFQFCVQVAAEEIGQARPALFSV